MKIIYKHLLISAIALLCMYSCDSFMDVHKEFVEGGEIIYSPKVDSIEFRGGRESVLVRAWLLNSPNVRSIDVFWNIGQDSVIIPVSASAGLDSVERLLPSMPEKAYTFDIRTTDNFGHKSLLVTGFGSSYGDVFQSSLANRRVKSVTITDKAGVIEWFPAGDNLVTTEIRYTDRNNQPKTVSIGPGASSIMCPEAKTDSKFTYRSLFIPEEKAIDTFDVAWDECETAFPPIYVYDRSEWSVLEVSDETESDGGGKNTLIDGDLGSYWHSQWGPDISLPHWAIIDIASSKDIIKIETYRRKGNTDSKSVKYYVGDDPDPDAATWTLIAEETFPSSGDLLTIDIPESVNTNQGRYLKLLLPDSNKEPFTSIAEIYLYGD